MFVITPSGMPYGCLKPEDTVIINFAGDVVEGGRKPSSETPLHSAIYRARQDVTAVVHTHSTYASACAVARMAIPPILEDLVQVVGGGVDVAEYALPGSEQLAENALRALASKNAVLLANHGVVAVGPNIDEAFKAAILIEKAAKVYIYSSFIGTPKNLSDEDVSVMREFYLHRYGQKTEYPREQDWQKP
jgi:L-fuculose-phosphate aldolase